MLAEDIRVNNLFERARAQEVKERLAKLQPDSARLWGKMNPAQALAHCSAAIGMAEGKVCRLLGPLAKKSLIVNGEPMRRNSMTDKSVIVADERDFTV